MVGPQGATPFMQITFPPSEHPSIAFSSSARKRTSRLPHLTMAELCLAAAYRSPAHASTHFVSSLRSYFRCMHFIFCVPMSCLTVCEPHECLEVILFRSAFLPFHPILAL